MYMLVFCPFSCVSCAPAGVGGIAKDMFDFGVILYELLTGNKSGPLHGHEDRRHAAALALWAAQFIPDAGGGVGGRRGRKDSDALQVVMHRLQDLAADCVQDDLGRRPDMNDMVLALQALQDSLSAL